MKKVAIKQSTADEYVGKTLGEAMRSLEGHIKIGTVGGAGVVFGGTVAQLAEELDDLNTALNSKAVQAYESAKKSVERMLTHSGTTVTDYFTSVFEAVEGNHEAFLPTMEGYLQFVERKIEVARIKATKVTETRLQVEEFRPTETRVIKSAYKATTNFDPQGTTMLIIEGNETGIAWTMDECRRIAEEKKHPNCIPFGSKEYEEVFGNE